MAAKAWFKLVNPDSKWDKISLEGIDDVADIKKAIKREMSPELDNYPASRLTIAATRGDKDDTHAVELGEEDDLASILGRFGVVSHPTIQGAFAREIRLFAHVPSGKLTEKELLLLTPPSLSYIPDNQRRKKTKTTTKSTWARTPVSVVGWQDFIEQTRAMAFENQTPQYDKPTFESLSVSEEEDVRDALRHNVLRVLTATIGSTQQPNEEFHRCSVTEGIQGRPDFILMGGPNLILVIEVKTKWALSVDDLVEMYKENRQDLAASRVSPVSVLDPIKQTFGYMGHNKLRYGVLSTYDRTWFLRRQGDNSGVLCISEVVKNSDTNPTLLQCFVYIMSLARENPDFASPPPSPPLPEDDYEPPSQKDDDGDSTYDPSEDSSPRGGERRKRVCRRGTGNTGTGHQDSAKGNQWGADDGQPEDLLRLEHFGWKSFDVGEVLGTGRSGTVFKAVFRGEEVALKLCDLWQHPEYEKEMLTEVRAYYGLKQLQGHTIPKLQAAGYTAGGLFAIATELAGSPVEVEELSDQERSKIVSALSTIHDHGFLHKDVRPENILVQRDRGGFKVRFIDFALSERISSKGETEKEMAILRMMLGLPSRPINGVGRFKRLCLAKTRSKE